MELSYSLRRSSKRKTLTITVERDREVVVHAPANTSDEVVRRVVESKRQWISQKLNSGQKYQASPAPGKELVSGESALYLGRSYQVEIAAKGATEIQFIRRFVIPASHAGGRKGAMREWYLSRANEEILPRVKRHALGLGVKFKRASIVDNRYRWGSCTIQDNVTFNWRLIKAPMFVIDYVIVHELAHLLEANHTPQFWNVVRTHVPRMDKARAWLNDNGQLLEEEI